MPFELISELCTWLYSDDEKAAPLIDFTAVIDRSTIEKANHNFLNAARLKLFVQNSLRDAVNAASETKAADHQRFHFLNFCLTYLPNNQQNSVQVPLCFLVLNYLIQPNLELDIPAKPAKVAALFAQLINLDEKRALDLYEKHPTFAQDFPAITQQVNILKKRRILEARVAAVDSNLKDLEALLLHEKNLLGIIPLFIGKIDDPYVFAALILYVLNKGVTADELIAKKILSVFLAYHLHSLSDEDNAVNTLYAVLDQLEIKQDPATKLAEKAKISPAKIQRLQSSYSLTGEIIKTMSIGDDTFDPFAFTVTNDNFKNLLSLFGDLFLYEALKYSTANLNDNDLKELLHSCLNDQDNHDLSRLSNLIKTLKETKPRLLEGLASLIDDATINKFIDQKNGLIFHLASYKPLIIDRLINTNDFKEYIKELIQSNGNRHDTLTQLVPLFKNANRHPDIQKFLYGEILKLMIGTTAGEDPIEDEGVITTLRLSRKQYYEETITQLANELTSQFEQSITSLKNDLSRNAYLDVEDTWRAVAKKFNLLKRLLNLNFPNFPTDKYALYTLVVDRLLKANINDFNLKDFLQNILLMQNEFAEADIGISEFERGLIEILTSVDDSQVRTATIELLDTTARKNEQWIEQRYDGKSVFSLAAIKNNVGLIEVLLTTKTADNIPSAFVSIAVVEAAKTNQWKAVRYLCAIKAGNKPDSNATSYVLPLAIIANQLAIVQELLAMSTDNKPSKCIVRSAFQFAAMEGKLEVVQAICKMQTDNKPDSGDISEALQLAVNANKLAIVKELLATNANNKCFSEVVFSALETAAKNGQWEIVSAICEMAVDNGLDIMVAAYGAFLKAAAANQWEILFVLCASCNAFQLEALRKLIEAGKWELVPKLCATQTDNKPGHNAIWKALKQEALEEAAAADKWEVVLALCAIQTDDKPDNASTLYALKQAARAGQLGVVKSLLAMAAGNGLDIAVTFSEALKEATPANLSRFASAGKLLITGTGFFSNTERQDKVCTIEEAFNKLEPRR
jgi:ankyrin repeat protein